MAEADGSTSPMKACKKCGETKPLTKFRACNRARDGREGFCNSCKEKARGPASKARASERARGWKKANPKQWRSAKQVQDERARRRKGMRSQAVVAGELAARREALQTQRRIAAEDRKARIAAKPWNAPGLSSAQKWKLQYDNDPEFNLREKLRASLRRRRFRSRIGERIRDALKGKGRARAIFDCFGYTATDLRVHLERQFAKGMTWAAFLAAEIEIDHVLPLSSFDLSDDDQFHAAWALSNLRPLWAADNASKGSRRTLLL